MKTIVKLSQLRNIAFAQPGQTSIIERLYTQKPERGGAKVAYRIAALRGTTIRLLGPDSAFESQRNQLLDEHFEPEQNGQRQPRNGPASYGAFEEAVKPLWDVTEEIDVELFSVDAIDAAGYQLSGAEIDALMGLLIQPETTRETVLAQ
jgi:hypothetical protein